MNLIVGATGELGGRVARRLLAQNQAVRVLVRNSSQYLPLERAGAEVAFGDLKEPDTLPKACRGARRVVATASASLRAGDDTLEAVDRDGIRHLINAAKDAGVEQFVYVSAYGFHIDAQVALARYKSENEAYLRGSGMAYTILKPVNFMESWIGFMLGRQLQQGSTVTIVGDGRTRHGFVAIDDVATLAVKALGHPEAQNTEISVNGPASHSYREIIGLLERATDRRIAVNSVEPGEPLPGFPPVVAELWAWLVEMGDVDIDMTETCLAFDLRLTSVASYIQRTFGSH